MCVVGVGLSDGPATPNLTGTMLQAQAFRRALADVGVTDVHFELFDGTHMSIEYRYPLGIKYLAERLGA